MYHVQGYERSSRLTICDDFRDGKKVIDLMQMVVDPYQKEDVETLNGANDEH